MELVQIRIPYEEGSKGGYYNYEFGFCADLDNYQRKYCMVYVDGPWRYDPEDQDMDNQPEEDWQEDRIYVYVNKTEFKAIISDDEIEED